MSDNETAWFEVECVVSDPVNGRTCLVDTREEDPEGRLFTLYDELHGSVSWGEVALIEGVAEALGQGRTTDARDHLSRLGLVMDGYAFV